ncbi:hypothetical protein DQX05_23920 [Paenibacillus thiaminolyticus]|uniref:Uncharacterized protein n=1 Tax=Paenibacillus thiaminolyticus TaxID=49283 RepID=A0A3A3GFY7_PANTH|nr:hypothetical protein DQX05_23920 [Paenibacillus thiaminolyticus]
MLPYINGSETVLNLSSVLPSQKRVEISSPRVPNESLRNMAADMRIVAALVVYQWDGSSSAWNIRDDANFTVPVH